MAAPIHAGDIFAGKYRIEGFLGRGGMAVVLAARHMTLGDQVAIKFPVITNGASDAAPRLVREGRAMMRIRSEHVARIYDVGTLDTGEPYLVMEYLVGTDLGAILDEQGALSIGDAIEYTLHATKGLAEAHARDIIHRDIKPANLFLTHGEGGSRIVKLIDFGVAKNMSAESETRLTVSYTTVGTPRFMAPEQMSSTRAINTRSDIWSLGATLHALVTGVPPFPRGSLVEIHEHIRKGPPPLRSLRPDAPEELEAIVLHCMQQKPADRFSSVTELGRALRAVLPERSPRSERMVTSTRSPSSGRDSGWGFESTGDTPVAPSDRMRASAKAGDRSTPVPSARRDGAPASRARGSGVDWNERLRELPTEDGPNPMGAEVFYRDEGLVVGLVDVSCVAIWRKAVTPTRMHRMSEALEGVALRLPGEASFLVVIEEGAPPPDGVMRRAMVKALVGALTRDGKDVTAVGCVIEGAGFGAAATRSALLGTHREHHPKDAWLNVFSTVTDAAAWLKKKAVIRNGATLPAEVESLRRMFGGPASGT